jgi:hypothetical protein
LTLQVGGERAHDRPDADVDRNLVGGQ